MALLAGSITLNLAVRRVAAVILAGLAAACAQEPLPELEISERFRMVGFRDDMGQPIRLHKWTAPLLVFADGASDEQRAIVEEHVTLLGSLTGLKARMEDDEPNMVVMFATEEELQSHLDEWARGGDRVNLPGFYRSDCFAMAGRRNGRHFAMAFIRDGQSNEKTRLCVVQEMTQALGLIGDIDGRWDTNFASWGGADHLTDADRNLIRILYDARLQDGMSESVGMPIVRQIVAEGLR